MKFDELSIYLIHLALSGHQEAWRWNSLLATATNEDDWTTQPDLTTVASFHYSIMCHDFILNGKQIAKIMLFEEKP
jgi:hypothetical protein